MKIGLVCPYNLWRGGGVQECVLALQSELERRGHTAKIITPQPRNINTSTRGHIIILGNSAGFRSFHTKGEISAVFNFNAIEEILEREKFDILHVHEPWLPLFNKQILTRSRSINIGTFHAALPDDTQAKTIGTFLPYAKSVQKYIDVMTAVSPVSAKYAKQVSPNIPLSIIPNGIDLAKYKSKKVHRSRHKTKTILYIGRLEKRKGIIYLLQAYNELITSNRSIRLLIAGDGPLREELERWTELNNLRGVKFLGYVEEKRKLELLNEADLFCSPALYGESFGIVLLEAMAMGLVTVAGNNPGYSFVLKNEGKVSLVDSQNTLAFTKKLELLLYNEHERTKWQSWAKNYVQQFDYTKVTDQYEAVYKRALKQKS